MRRPAAPGSTGRRGPMANDSGVPTPETADEAEAPVQEALDLT